LHVINNSEILKWPIYIRIVKPKLTTSFKLRPLIHNNHFWGPFRAFDNESYLWTTTTILQRSPSWGAKIGLCLQFELKKWYLFFWITSFDKISIFFAEIILPCLFLQLSLNLMQIMRVYFAFNLCRELISLIFCFLKFHKKVFTSFLDTCRCYVLEKLRSCTNTKVDNLCLI